jgi:hypothetical protein
MLLASLPNQQVDQLNLQRHFANEIWKHNTAEIMGHPGTNADVFDTLVAFEIYRNGSAAIKTTRLSSTHYLFLY